MTGSQHCAITCRVCGAGPDGTLWRENGKGVAGIWSCAKHRGRMHCVVPGCRRTFAPRAGEAFDLDHLIVCGRHWRMAPRPMRQIEQRVRRLGKKLGWPDAMIARHDRIWNRCLRSIVSRPIEADLERLGL